MSNANVTPEALLKIGTGFMAAKHLFVAVEIGLFEALADGPRTLDEIADALGVPRRTARISADAVVALGLVRREGDRYANGPEAGAFLAGKGPVDMRAWARFWNRISFPAWEGLEQTVRSGVAAHAHKEFTPAEAEIFSKGVAGFTRGAANGVVAKYDLQRHRKVLDVGGGTGSFLTTILEQHPRLSATLFELPSTARVAREVLAKSTAGRNVAVAEGDALASPLPEGHDLVLVANVAHCMSPDANVKLLHNIRRAIAPRSRVLLVDLWTDPTHTQPLLAALMAGEFAVLQPDGDVYSVDEARGWLASTGFSVVAVEPLGGPATMIVAEAT